MKIQLDPQFTLTSDLRNFILIYKTGCKEYRTYHPTIASAVESYLGISQRLSNATSIKELLEHQSKVLGNLKATLLPLKLEVKAYS